MNFDSQFRLATFAAAVFAALVLSALAGCGESGPPRFDLAGTVTYQGELLPRGYIVFTPDSGQGNRGPGATAEIENGRYATAPGQGVIGGPHTASISGFDGQSYQDGPVTIPNGRSLFDQMNIAVDLPRKDGEHNFELPVKATD